MSTVFYFSVCKIPLSFFSAPETPEKNPPLCPYLRKIKSHAWMTGGPLLWHPSWASVLRSSSETTSALCCLPHWTHYNLHTAETVPQTTLLPSPCTLALSHLENKNTYVRMLFVDYSSAFNTIVPATLVRSSRLWDWTDLCAAGSWTSWQAEVRWSEWATTPHLPWSSTLVPRRAASSAHSCTACTHTTVQLYTAPTSSSNLPMTQRW